LPRDQARLGPIIRQLKSLGCRVSLFMDAQVESMKWAADLGADRVELYTAPYAEAFARGDRDAAAAYAAAARRCGELGLGINAGHDLNLQNLPAFVREVPGVLEVSIGHALIADALEFGLPVTVAKYLQAVQGR
jgi:pyridoxine 5-phosphate synthase